MTDENATSLSSSSFDDVVVIDELAMKLEICWKKLVACYKMNPIQFEKVSHSALFSSLFSMPFRMTFLSRIYENLPRVFSRIYGDRNGAELISPLRM